MSTISEATSILNKSCEIVGTLSKQIKKESFLSKEQETKIGSQLSKLLNLSDAMGKEPSLLQENSTQLSKLDAELLSCFELFQTKIAPQLPSVPKEDPKFSATQQIAFDRLSKSRTKLDKISDEFVKIDAELREKKTDLVNLKQNKSDWADYTHNRETLISSTQWKSGNEFYTWNENVVEGRQQFGILAQRIVDSQIKINKLEHSFKKKELERDIAVKEFQDIFKSESDSLIRNMFAPKQENELLEKINNIIVPSANPTKA